VISQAQSYLSGLLQATKRNVQRMAEVVPGTDAQALHHFLAHSPWDARAVMDQVAREVGEVVGGDQETCLLLDETCFAKKGRRSVGVARQWFGLQGKTDNCQVAVFAAVARGKSVSLIDTELYLPREWVEDPARCAAAGDEAGVGDGAGGASTPQRGALCLGRRRRDLRPGSSSAAEA
jgi:SRSO17 transposase